MPFPRLARSHVKLRRIEAIKPEYALGRVVDAARVDVLPLRVLRRVEVVRFVDEEDGDARRVEDVSSERVR